MPRSSNSARRVRRERMGPRPHARRARFLSGCLDPSIQLDLSSIAQVRRLRGHASELCSQPSAAASASLMNCDQPCTRARALGDTPCASHTARIDNAVRDRACGARGARTCSSRRQDPRRTTSPTAACSATRSALMPDRLAAATGRSPAWPSLDVRYDGTRPAAGRPARDDSARASSTTATATAARSTSSSNVATAPSSVSRSRPPPRRRRPTFAVCDTCGASSAHASRPACCSTRARAACRSAIDSRQCR